MLVIFCTEIALGPGAKHPDKRNGNVDVTDTILTILISRRQGRHRHRQQKT